jgi:hypothetical protein
MTLCPATKEFLVTPVVIAIALVDLGTSSNLFAAICHPSEFAAMNRAVIFVSFYPWISE